MKSSRLTRLEFGRTTVSPTDLGAMSSSLRRSGTPAGEVGSGLCVAQGSSGVPPTVETLVKPRFRGPRKSVLFSLCFYFAAL